MKYELDNNEKNEITQWAASNHKNRLKITLATPEHEQTPFFEAFCNALEEASPDIDIKINKDSNLKLPAIILNENITFHAVPRGKIFSSFIAPPSPSFSPRTIENINKIEIPVELKLYIANMCPHCPGVVSTILPLAAASKHINLSIIDGTLFVDQASKDNVMSAPCLILDNDFRWTGSVTQEEVTDMIANRDISSLSTSSLRSILEEGKAELIAAEMTKQNIIFPGFTGLLLHEIWSVRLGAMVVVEELAEKNPDLALKICPKLLQHFDDSDIPTKGDILYALGESGDLSVKDKIVKLMTKITIPDLIEAAQEAIEAIEERNRT
ncbi:putative HAD family hydrolase [Desulfamplus magnetovallimortis]|uniref:Putative HAD family hydrolase n=1 Tax=Desulfamplus magnetovallimortis TaxID=1246637 RepID=A0A1W1H8M3_9BACT|nr:thioredoxin family protein [Desulfamplus magnetovallimortis]SLM28809.1 putative HAD family hydrolase [Desulfamplus magnetovallimortis]